MQNRFKTPDFPLVVYTDLDGTLLDHDSYSFEPARPALTRLKSLSVPVIPVTSKTLAELSVLMQKLGLVGPCIAENGGLIAIPIGYFEQDTLEQRYEDFYVEFLSPDHAEIVAMLQKLRQTFGFKFRGFADFSVTEIAELTGLSMEEAVLARERLCSEPLVWYDDDVAFNKFQNELGKRNFTLVRGGRFHHVLGATDKAVAIEKLSRRFTQAGFTDFTSIALGDSPNDLKMLDAANVAVVIRRKDESWLQFETHAEKVETQSSGPQGWNDFFQNYLDKITSPQSTKRAPHG